MKKLGILLLCLCLLTGCSVQMKSEMTTENNTNSNITSSTTVTAPTTEMPTAKPVNGTDTLSAKKIVWGPGAIQNHTPPAEPKRLQAQYETLAARWLNGEEKTVLLTFDEGYENGYTPAILDILKEQKVKAVFFVTYDFAKDNPKLIARMIKEGHTVGNHSWHHYAMDELDTATATQEVMHLHRYIEDTFGYTMRYFRFPKGEFSEQNLALLQKLGYESIFWSFAYEDWDPDAQPAPNEAFTHICEGAHPGEILLLHAVSKTNTEILPRVIADFRHQGYTFTTLD